jgi:outer membrane protein assembly factor BamB
MPNRELARHWRALVVGVASLAGLAGCGGHHHLAEYSFTGHSLGLVFIAPPAPVLYTGHYGVRTSDNVLSAVVRVGGDVAKDVEAHHASARLDSAATRIDVAALLANRTLERAGRYLGMQPSTAAGNADFVLEIQMRNVGIDASRESAAYLFTNAEAVLLDRRTGREIWSATVHGSDRLTPSIHSDGNLPVAIITAGTLRTVSVADFQQALDQLATLSSNVIADVLRADLRKARN